eukprot:CAMPEP_0119169486 /NCGR_PEP_ID=MMETSP1315-20130426/10183_1 /TAXON_ID=676789 /ORGANISM="Prasinoderma singularis, Strain RCC927" /LENGTH=115 /DNA_ID=CAMNT_0007163087 /DNA_START=235 /DNA_END=579 /DNA_ORIENTATION=-
MCCRAAAPHSATRRAAAGLLKCVVTSEMGWLFPARSSALQGFQGYRGFFVGFCEVMTTADAAYVAAAHHVDGGGSCASSGNGGPEVPVPVYVGGGGRARCRSTTTVAADARDGRR